MKLHHKIVLVTGGNSGIGRAIALRAAAEGAHVAITGRASAKGAKVLGELQAAGALAAFFAADLGDETQAAKLVRAVAALFGHIDVVVNNAGAGARRAGRTIGKAHARQWRLARPDRHRSHRGIRGGGSKRILIRPHGRA